MGFTFTLAIRSVFPQSIPYCIATDQMCKYIDGKVATRSIVRLDFFFSIIECNFYEVCKYLHGFWHLLLLVLQIITMIIITTNDDGGTTNTTTITTTNNNIITVCPEYPSNTLKITDILIAKIKISSHHVNIIYELWIQPTPLLPTPPPHHPTTIHDSTFSIR